jgi:hypothetical protein
MDHARKAHAAAAMRMLIDANFGWRILPHRQTGHRPLAGETRKAIGQSHIR